MKAGIKQDQSIEITHVSLTTLINTQKTLCNLQNKRIRKRNVILRKIPRESYESLSHLAAVTQGSRKFNASFYVSKYIFLVNFEFFINY